jgi:integrase
MEKRSPGRPAAEFPYVCGPYKHRSRYRIIIVTGRGRSGRQSYTRSFDSRAKAAAWTREFQRQVRAAGRTIEDAVTEYIARAKRKGNKPGTIATTGYRLKAILDYSMPLVDLTPRRAQELYDELVDEGGAVDTHHGCLVQARAFGRFCHDQSWLSVNPFLKVEAVGKKSRGKEQLRLDEARTFLSYCFHVWREDRDRGAIAAALPLLLNMRASEVAQLTARDVDDRGKLLWIAEADGKTDAARRRALVPAVLVPALVEMSGAPVTEGGHLFCLDNESRPADRHWVSRSVKRMLAGAKVPLITTHGLRGTHATLATVEGVTGDAVARAMGHTNAGMTERHYIDSEVAADAQVQRVADSLIDDREWET